MAIPRKAAMQDIEACLAGNYVAAVLIRDLARLARAGSHCTVARGTGGGRSGGSGLSGRRCLVA